MDEVLEEIRQLRVDLNIPKIAYVTIEDEYGDWDFSTIHVYTDPSQIPYLESDYDEYVTLVDVEKMEVGDSITGDKFKITKTRIN
jgi:hypothetical protein